MRFLKGIFSLLSARQRRRYVWLSAYFLFAAVIQVLGVASVAPFIALVSNPQLIHSNEVSQWVYVAIGADSDKEFLAAFAFGLMALIVATNAVMAFAAWLIASFSMRVGIELQQDMYSGILHRDYGELTQFNSAELISAVTNDVSRYIYMVLQPLLTLVSQAFVVALVTIGLIVYDPRVALTAGIIIGGGYGLIFTYLKVQIHRNGELAWMSAARKLRILNESLGGVKEIKLAGTERHYERELDAVSSEGLNASIRLGLLGDLPRFLLESIAFSALLGLGIYLLRASQQPQDIVGILSLYAMAGYKLMPAAQTIFKSSSQIRANINIAEALGPSVRMGRKPVKDDLPIDTSIVPTPQEIRFADVSYRYPRTEHDVVQHLDFVIPARGITVLVGASGAGKSTAADILLGLLTPSSGEVLVGDVPISRDIRGWQRRLGYVAQSIFLLDDTIATNIAFGSRGPIDQVKLRRAADLAHVTEFALALKDGFESRVGEHGGMLSGGQRQRIGLARALYREASVLVLDEATSALDALTEREIISTLAELKRDKTIVMIAHRVSTIRAADFVLMFDKGKVVANGNFDELLSHSDAFNRLLAGSAGGRTSPSDALQIA